MKKVFSLLFVLMVMTIGLNAKDHQGITFSELSPDRFTLIADGVPTDILMSEDDMEGVKIAAGNLVADFERVCGRKPQIKPQASGKRLIIVGSLESRYIQQMVKARKIDAKDLKGRTEKYIMQWVANPINGVDEALVIAGSDMRGTIYGIYELSEQIGVSPWYYWADVPVAKASQMSIAHGKYTAGEPAVRYRGIFLNDEAPCLTTWVKNTFGTEYGGHEFYAHVFELILRLRGNFLWPAMWGWSFYADDPLNSKTADDMGVVMGTSHHEPMARNHQEWARHRNEYGAWDYATNQQVIDKFFREGIERAKDTEDLITIGMRGDGDTAMGGKEGHDDELSSDDKAIMQLLQTIIANQRKIISEVTGQPASKRPQVWALYKEVQRYYDLGMKVPEDAIILLSDDNWGDVRRLPSAAELKGHKGGFGMYYHVDYVGAPRNTKWLNVTPIQHMWEQLQLTYDYGVDKLWVLNVGDLKPMEYPIDLFLDMAWDPARYKADNLLDHTRQYCAEALGEEYADDAQRLLNLYSKYAGRVTPEMLDARTYNVESGEWDKVCGEWIKLEAEALRLYAKLPSECHDAYQQLILFPIQAFGNLYEMYCAQAKNMMLSKANLPEANVWADKVEECFKRDAELCHNYNKVMANGKWDGMMIQKHIGYTSWNDNFPADRMPQVHRVAVDGANTTVPVGGYTFTGKDGVVVIEAEHCFSKTDAANSKWTIIPDMGRTLSGVSLMPYTQPTSGANLNYKFTLPNGVESVKVYVITNATLPFKRADGHRYTVAIDGASPTEVNFNYNLKDVPQYAYSIYYPTVARRVVEKDVTLPVPSSLSEHTLTLSPLDEGIVFEKIVIDYGGYKRTYLYMDESPCVR